MRQRWDIYKTSLNLFQEILSMYIFIHRVEYSTVDLSVGVEGPKPILGSIMMQRHYEVHKKQRPHCPFVCAFPGHLNRIHFELHLWFFHFWVNSLNYLSSSLLCNIHNHHHHHHRMSEHSSANSPIIVMGDDAWKANFMSIKLTNSAIKYFDIRKSLNVYDDISIAKHVLCHIHFEDCECLLTGFIPKCPSIE